MSKTVAIVKWAVHDGIAQVLGQELTTLGYHPVYFLFDSPIPAEADIVFSFAPYGRFSQVSRQLGNMSREKRPTLLHWSTENPPDIRMPWAFNRVLAGARSRLDFVTHKRPFAAFKDRMIRYRIMGDYLTAYGNGWMQLFVESSLVFQDLYSRNGLPAQFAPWGSVKSWYADLQLERDIDVLWMGQRRTRRRSNAIEKLRADLQAAGYHMHVADGVENPFLYGEERTRMLNRSKITLSLLAQAPYDNIFHYRFRLAAPNRSLLLAEQELPHCTVYQAGKHYVETPTEALTGTLLHYLEHAAERNEIVENAYQLSTTQMTLGASVRTIMAEAERMRSQRQ